MGFGSVSGRPYHVAAWMTWPMVMFAAAIAWAGTVVCPVCGETFHDDLEECPNDGTNLKLVGKDSSTADKVDGADGREDTTHEEAPSGQDANDGAPIRYKRHDEGGERMIAPSGGDDRGYSDRQSRLPGDTRIASPAKVKKETRRPAANPPAKRSDSAVLVDFESNRRRSWAARESVRLRESNAARDRAAGRKKLLQNLGAPLTSLGGRLFWMGEGNGPGPVGAAEIDVNLARYRVRAGISTLLGVRALDTRNELVFLESLSIGGEWPARFAPYVIAKGGIGVLATSRFGVDQAYLFAAFGGEAGVDAWINPWLAVTPSFGYMRCSVKNAYWNSFTFKVSVGF